MKMNENFFAIYCRGDPMCDEVWIIPISRLAHEMEMANVETLQELAEGYICPHCIMSFETITHLPDPRT